ncbi:MAG TPA: alpha-2-macroglobulin family protein [Thermoanaerobaculia bacterium]|nr:alpha-2-macroglobulin family protein [Thermoanaerobaculia bacterium]
MITASTGSRQAYLAYEPDERTRRQPPEEWRIHAFTDRPAYRACETVRWKMIARTGREERWVTPAGRSVEYRIQAWSYLGPVLLTEGVATLNAFGSFSDELVVPAHMPATSYTIDWTVDGRTVSAPLFVVEPTVLPGVTLSVATPEGRRYLVGDSVDASFTVTDSAGRPLAATAIDVTVFRRSLGHFEGAHRQSPLGGWIAPRDSYSEYDMVAVETVHTDASGRAVLHIDTYDGADVTYRIEARTADSAGGEVSGGKTLHVMHDPYVVVVEPERSIVAPNERTLVRFSLHDAAGRPVAALGNVDVRRRRGTDRTYSDEHVVAAKIASGPDGEATFTLTAKRSGYYIVRWTSTEPGATGTGRATAHAPVWVAGRDTKDIGYFAEGGLQIHVDPKPARSGASAPVLLLAPSPGQRVLLSAVAEGFLDSRVLHLPGTAKVVNLPLDQRHVPGFTAAASSVFQRELSSTREPVVVQRRESFLTVMLKADREEYAPGDEATLTITTLDHAGKPVPAEVAVAVTDHAVTGTRFEPSQDLRAEFYKLRPYDDMAVSGSVQGQTYLRRTAADVIEAASTAAMYGVGVIIKRYDDARSARLPDPEVPWCPRYYDDGVRYFESIDVPLRSDFRSTASWTPGIITDANGSATVRFTVPDLAATWRVRAHASTAASAFGTATIFVTSGAQ